MSKKRKRDPHTLQFWCICPLGKFQLIEFPSALGQNYIDTFGLLQTRTKAEMESWLGHHHVSWRYVS